MRLNRLEISGFKSFPDRADLAFDRGVTAIVGPNGCGKSNVVDAITWVLGEQSAKSLRGERMEDVIFGGSDARKPTAAAEVRLKLADVPSQAARAAAARLDPALGSATGDGDGDGVQMTLPATDARDVEIARRLYRSGESEYLIDGDVVRLRDVQDLLMDGGLGVRAYAVIEQGKIGQILSAKPTERRLLIEEAAGVTKYKSRRRSAELKLEAAQQNLARVDDVIFEIEKQRASLKRQAAKARRYRALREELRRWEKVLFARRYRALAQAIEAARARLAEAREREAQLVSEFAACERRLDATRADLAALEARATAARDTAHACELDTERRQQQLAFDRQQVDGLADAVGILAAELTDIETRRAPAQAELEQRRAASAEAETSCQEAAGHLAGRQDEVLDAQRRVQSAEAAVEDARRQASANAAAVVTLRNVIERAREAAERLAGEMTRLDGEAGDLRIEVGRVTAEREQFAEALRGVQSAVEQSRQAMALRGVALAAERAGRERQRADLRASEREAASLDARLRSLEELEAAREGYGDAARAILADPRLGLTHAGAVADVVEAEPAYERAVEACLGDLLQFVLVASHDVARRGLELVRARNLGRCGFLVTGADGQSPAAAAPPAAGLVALASVLRVSGPHAAAITSAVGEAWVADSFEAAAEASRTTLAPVVSLAGDVFRAGRLVSGGSRAEGRGLLTTKRELRELRERTAAAHEQAARLANGLIAVDAAVGEHEQVIADLAAALHAHEKAGVGAEVQVSRAAGDLDRLARRLDLVASERRRIVEEREAQLTRQEEAQQSVGEHEQRQRDLDTALEEAARRLAGARESFAEVSDRLAEARARHAALVERAAGVANDVRRLEESCRELEQRFASRSAERERSLARRLDLEAAIDAGAARLADEQQALGAAREEVRRAEAAAGERSEEFGRVDAEARSARVLVEEARAALAHLDVARATAESDLVHLAASCQEALQAPLDEVAAEVEALEAQGAAEPQVSALDTADDADLDADPEAAGTGPASLADGDAAADRDATAVAEAEDAKAEGLHARALTAEEAIATLRARIDRLGAVNMMAIEQFEELEQRHQFLTGQHADLVESIAQTSEAIRRIDRTTRERFQEAFAAITRYFEETFQTLFGGGRAGLVLIDESDQLESGIDIVAQPPGKRLQNVQLLSGGEKALTAMALMFSIFRYRPSPFCLLDEIDAPLDDANIGRFIEMLRGMQDRTQFILVTHHRKTMEIADRLYGVTMEEPGVSKLISLKLN